MSDHEDFEYLDPDDDRDEYCFECQNLGTVECLCGGDLCVCLNHGEKPCPRCG